MIDPILIQFVQTRSPEAFRMLVDRHGKQVYAQCVRELRDLHWAEDVTQAVFMVLAQRATTLPAQVVLPAWLFKVTRFACANAKRGEHRRKLHEHEAAMTRELQAQPSHAGTPSDLEWVVDQALTRLGSTDRQAIVLRFYSDLDLAQVAQALGMSAEATRRRISRALEKLRAMLTRTDASLTPAVLLTIMTNLSRTTPPVGLVERVVAHALHPAAATPGCGVIVKGTLHMMRWTKIKMGVAAALALLVVGAAGAAAVNGVLDPPSAPSTQPTGTPGPVTSPSTAPITVRVDAPTDQDLIRDTIARTAHAIRSGDLKALDQYTTVSDDADGALVKTMILENVAYRHLQTAWGARFNGQVKLNVFSFVWIPDWDGGAEVVLEHVLPNLLDSDIQISGNTARFPLRTIPHGLKGVQPQSFMEGWWVAMVNDGTNWKLDLSKTLHVNVSLTFAHGKQPTSTEQEIKIALEAKQGGAKILENVAQAIERGEIATASDARKRLESKVTELDKSLGLAGLNYSFAPAVPVSTEMGN